MPAPASARAGYGGHQRFAAKKTELPACARMTAQSEAEFASPSHP